MHLLQSVRFDTHYKNAIENSRKAATVHDSILKGIYHQQYEFLYKTFTSRISWSSMNKLLWSL